MTEEQITAKLQKWGSDLGLTGHITSKDIILGLAGHIELINYIKLYNMYAVDWKFGDAAHIELITEIERILTEKGILS